MNYKWVVLFLVHASDKTTRKHAKELFNILKSTDYNEEIKVLVLYGGLQYSVNGDLKIQVTLKEIVKDNSSNQLDLNEVSPVFGKIDIGDDKRLSKIFSNIRENYPCERFLLFTWDHGSGFGIFNTDPRERDLDDLALLLNNETDFAVPEKKEPASAPDDSLRFTVITNQLTDEYEGSRDLPGGKKKIITSMLTIDELSKIIKYDAPAKKVDLLVMMNCTMQMIETGYALNDAVEYLVAPETCIFWAGYDYTAIINRLCSHPETETEAMGKFVLDTLEAHYQRTPYRKYFNDLVVSLVKPSRVAEVKTAIDEIADHLNGKLDDSFQDIKAIRFTCEDVSMNYVERPFQYIDFLNCITALAKITDGIDLDTLKQVVNDYVIHIVRGTNFNQLCKETGTGRMNGFSIYFPCEACEADEDFYYDWFYKAGNHQTLFAAQSSWKGFLMKYIRLDRKTTGRANFSL